MCRSASVSGGRQRSGGRLFGSLERGSAAKKAYNFAAGASLTAKFAVQLKLVLACLCAGSQGKFQCAEGDEDSRIDRRIGRTFLCGEPLRLKMEVSRPF